MGDRGWTTLVWGLCCVSGALLFLRIAADAISLSQFRLRALDWRLQTAQRQRLEREEAARRDAENEASQEAA